MTSMNVLRLVIIRWIYNSVIRMISLKRSLGKVITRQLEEIKQFSKGLKELNVLQNLKLFKDETINEFIVSSANKLTSKILQEIFKEVKYSECEEK